MRGERTRTMLAAAAALLGASTPGAFGQATLYTAGDPAATTTLPRGREVCGTLRSNMVSIDGRSFETMSASEFAATAPGLRGSVPNPMGRNTPAASSGKWAVTVVNPTADPITVTQVDISAGAVKLFNNGPVGVQPLSGWAMVGANTGVRWTGTQSVPAYSAFDFIVRVPPRSQPGTNVPIALSAGTSVGPLASTTAFTTTQSGANIPYVSLPFVEGGNDVYFAGVAASSGGAVETGKTKTFTVKVQEVAGTAIPAGSALQIRVPPGWTSVTALTGQPGFNNPAITPGAACGDPTLVTTSTNAPIQSAFQLFRFSATAPANQGSPGLYQFDASFTSAGTVPPQTTVTELVQEVSTPPATGTRDGITAVGLYMSIPNPMGSTKFTTWGVAVANPTATTLTVTSLDINMWAGDRFFKTFTPVTPTTGWTYWSESLIQWQGSLKINPYEAANFVIQIQANNKDFADRPVRVTLNSSLIKDAMTTQGLDNPPATSLYYLASGQPVVYTYGVAAGQVKSFQVAVHETQSVNIAAGTELKVTIPKGWSAVSAPATQAGFTTPTIQQPTAVADGWVRTTISPAFKNARRIFTYRAKAPPDLLQSLFVFPTTLKNPQVNTLCEALVKVTDAAGGLDVRHLSPPLTQTAINQIDVHVEGSAIPDEDLAVEVYNFADSAWEPLRSATLGSSSTTLLGSITTSFTEYYDPARLPDRQVLVRMVGANLDNFRLREDYVAYIVSEYNVRPTDRAPATTFRGALRVTMLKLLFETQAGTVDLYTVKVRATGTAPLTDIAAVRLLNDLNCNGVVDGGEGDLAPPQPLGPGGTVTFGAAPAVLLSFSQAVPRCAIVAYDIAAGATAFNVVGASIASGFDLTSSVGPLYPFPCIGGYPIESSQSLIPGGPPQVDLDKLAEPPLVPPQTGYEIGTTVTYSITARNIGESPATSIAVTDPLDPSWAPYTGVITPLDGGSLCLPPGCPTPRVVWPVIPSLQGNGSETVTLRFRAVVPKGLADGSSVPNAAQATFAEQPVGSAPIQSNNELIPVCSPDLQVDKSLPPTPPEYAEGEVITWTLTVVNDGSCPATGVVMRDTIDPTLLDPASIRGTLDGAPNGSFDGVTNTWTWASTSVAENGAQARTYTLAGTIRSGTAGRSLCNTGRVTWDQGAGEMLSNPPSGSCTRIAPPRCSWIIVADKSLPPTPPDYSEGETITWTIGIRNDGSCPATGLRVRDVLDTTLLDEATIQGTLDGVRDGSFDVPTSTYTWSTTNLAGGAAQTRTYTLSGVIKAGAAGQTLCNVARVNWNENTAGEVITNPQSGSCTDVPIIPPRCSPGSIPASTALMVVRSGSGREDIDASWTGSNLAVEHHLNSVTRKTDLPAPRSRRTPQGVGNPECTGAPACVITGAVTAAPDRVYYQSYGACGFGGDQEGAY